MTTTSTNPTMTTDTMDRPCGDADVLALPLSNGSHGLEFHGECCLVEKANRIAYCIPEFRERFGAPERFADDHPSISRAVRSMAIGLNDLRWASDDERTAALDRFTVAILGTATTPEDEETRAWMATDWLVRTYTPAWLRLAGLTDEAQALESLARVVDAVTASAAQPTLDAAREKSDAARDAAGAAARAAARDAAWAAAWAAARDAAGDAAWAAAGAAAWAALAPTSLALRTSAIALLDAMIAVGKPAAAEGRHA